MRRARQPLFAHAAAPTAPAAFVTAASRWRCVLRRCVVPCPPRASAPHQRHSQSVTGGPL